MDFVADNQTEVIVTDADTPSTRGRKPKPALVPEAAQAMDNLHLSIQQSEELYGDGDPYDLDLLIEKAKVHTRVIAESMVKQGRAFLRIKAHEEHGTYTAALEKIGVTQAFAWFAMQAAVKIGDSPNHSALNDLGSAKMRSLLVFDKPVIQEYLNGGDLATIPRDDVEKMTSRELEAEVRKLRAEQKKQKDMVKEELEKNALEMADLKLKVQYQQPPTKEHLAQVELDALQKPLLDHLLDAYYYLDKATDIVVEAQKIEGVTFEQLQRWAKRDYEKMADINEMYEELDHALNNCCPDRPKDQEV